MSWRVFLCLWVASVSVRPLAAQSTNPQKPHEGETSNPAITPPDLLKDTNQAASAEQRRQALQETLMFIGKKLNEVPVADRSKPIARTEDPTVDNKKVRPGVAGFLNNNSRFARPASDNNQEFEAKEIVNFNANQGIQAVAEVLKDNKLSNDFVNFTQDYDLKGAVDLLKTKVKVNEDGGETTKRQNAALVVDDDVARVGYLAAAYKIYKQTQVEKANPIADAANAAMISNSRLSDSVNAGANDFTSQPLHIPDLGALAAGYLDLAAKQITNAGNTPSRSNNGDVGLSSPFKNNTELNNLFSNALNTANSLDLNKADISSQIKPFKELINSKEFLENGARILGKENADALVSAVQSAELLNAASGNFNATAAEYLSGAFNLGTGVSSPPCIGCVEGKNSPLAKAADQYAPSDEKVNGNTQDWLDEAAEIANRASKDRALDPKQVGAIMKGRQELDKLIATLELYKSVGVLNKVEVPSSYSMSRHYKDAAEIAAGILFNVRQKRLKNTLLPVVLADWKKVKKSAGDLLEKLKLAKTPANVENVLRNFFEKNENNVDRALWRQFEDNNYRKLRSVTAQIIMARSLALLKIPTFEKVTVERASVAYLVTRAFESLRVRKAQALKEHQLKMGLLKLPDIKMADEQKKPMPQPFLRNEDEEDVPARAPSFIEEK